MFQTPQGVISGFDPTPTGAATIVDNGDPGFTLTNLAQWTNSTDAGFGGDYAFYSGDNSLPSSSAIHESHFDFNWTSDGSLRSIPPCARQRGLLIHTLHLSRALFFFTTDAWILRGALERFEELLVEPCPVMYNLGL